MWTSNDKVGGGLPRAEVLVIRCWGRCRFELWNSLNEFLLFFLGWVFVSFFCIKESCGPWEVWSRKVQEKAAILAWRSIFPPLHMVYATLLFWIDCLVESINSSRFILRASRQLCLLCFWSLFVCEIHSLVLVFFQVWLFLFLLALCSFTSFLLSNTWNFFLYLSQDVMSYSSFYFYRVLRKDGMMEGALLLLLFLSLLLQVLNWIFY